MATEHETTLAQVEAKSSDAGDRGDCIIIEWTLRGHRFWVHIGVDGEEFADHASAWDYAKQLSAPHKILILDFTAADCGAIWSLRPLASYISIGWASNGWVSVSIAPFDSVSWRAPAGNYPSLDLGADRACELSDKYRLRIIDFTAPEGSA